MTIGFAYPAQTIWNMWVNLKKSGFDDRCSIRVFEGHVYSLMDDDNYYEGVEPQTDQLTPLHMGPPS